ncbi:MAG: hypothetical protein ACR2OR_14830 [Hyphomicrobiales bacterium]
MKMRYLIPVLCLLGWFATPALSESNDLINNLGLYKLNQKELEYQQYKSSGGTYSNFSSETFGGVPKTGQGFLYKGNRQAVPGENTFGRTRPNTQGGLKIQF